MESKLQSSFIPKGPAAAAMTAGFRPRVEKQHGLLGLLALVVFVLSIAAAGGVFGYKLYLVSSIAKMGSNLSAAEASIDPAAIKDITGLNDRIVATGRLLNSHVIISPLFDYLEKNTLQNVAFTSFSYENTANGLTLNMKGVARGYQAVSLQAAAFSQSPYFKNQSFSDLSLDDKGQVSFSYSASIDPKLVSFVGSLAPLSAAVAATTTATTTAAVATSTSVTKTAATTTATTTPKTVAKNNDSCKAGDFDCVILASISCSPASVTITSGSSVTRYKVVGKSSSLCHSQIVYQSGSSAGKTNDCISSNADLSSYLTDAKSGTAGKQFLTDSCSLIATAQ